MKSLSMGTMAGPSKILDRRWREKEQLIHKKKLAAVKSSIRQQQALPYNVPYKNAKKEVQAESK